MAAAFLMQLQCQISPEAPRKCSAMLVRQRLARHEQAGLPFTSHQCCVRHSSSRLTRLSLAASIAWSAISRGALLSKALLQQSGSSVTRDQHSMGPVNRQQELLAAIPTGQESTAAATG